MVVFAGRWWTPPTAMTLRDGRAWPTRLISTFPPPYRPHPGEPVYEIAVDGRAVQIADGDLLGPLRELTIGVLTEGWQII